ncbi:Unannotated [Lentimonas sp. CC4]|nr:Unannotated [Lentimonas sp. CC4]CAA6683668.1 Unannotated [Lentimonas sp. CC6]CAA7074485.1 Unannotated [Lentimonas sp. CC4]CAA7169095.1 Unannotated [Lentimonas sp. CC21]CAA7180497.1 Unannotated [Lentimonas sp. CC8]
MKQLTTTSILLGIVLLILAIASTVLVFNLRSQQPTATQPTIESPK